MPTTSCPPYFGVSPVGVAWFAAVAPAPDAAPPALVLPDELPLSPLPPQAASNAAAPVAPAVMRKRRRGRRAPPPVRVHVRDIAQCPSALWADRCRACYSSESPNWRES